jgi:SAM-dependent methyltransferase
VVGNWQIALKEYHTPENFEDDKNVSEYLAFHKKLSVLVEPYLDKRWTLADIGCGQGLLAFNLAPMVKHIFAVDVSSAAIDELEKRLDELYYIRREDAEKIEAVVADAENLGELRADVMLLSFFGASRKILDDVFERADRRVIIIMRGREVTGIDMIGESYSEFSSAETEAYLEEKGYRYKKNTMEMQLGKPFRTIEEIHRFLGEYGQSLCPRDADCISLGVGCEGIDEIEARVAGAEERIIKTNRFDFPYYLPKSINVAIYIAVKTSQ